MKKIWLLILWLLSLSFAWNNTFANYEYEYTSLDITADILNDWTINVKEYFTADFFVYKHWIIRSIPLNYSVSNHPFHIDISNIKVQWNKFSTSKNHWTIEIKIWDANKTVVWEQYYPISYTTYWLIRNFSWMWYSELYWNLVGYDFDTNINKVRAELILPKVYTWFTKDNFLITTDWASKTIDWFEWTVDWSRWDKIIITYNKWLPAYNWITLAIKFPNNYFNFDYKKQKKLIGYAKDSLWESWVGYGLVQIVIAIIILIFSNASKDSNNNVLNNITDSLTNKIDRKSWTLKWDFSKQFPVIVQYEPPKWINSAEAWLLIHRGAKPKDMFSLIYKWASEWLIKLSFEEESWGLLKPATKNIIITKVRDINPNLPKYEKRFFEALVRSEKNKINSNTNLYYELSLSDLNKYWNKNWWFTGGKNYSWAAVIWFIIFSIISSAWNDSPLITIIVFFGLVSLILFIASAAQLKETEEWAKLISHLLWYREFLATCDENKLRLFLQQDPLYFDKVLPYAVAFGLDTELINKMVPIMQQMNIKPTWYDWNANYIYYINNTISESATHSVPHTSYDSDSWFSDWSSFSWWWFSSWGWGWWWGGRSW